MFTGLALIILGVLATGAQLTAEFITPGESPRAMQSIVVSPNRLEAGTRFVGLELIIVGALLQIVGFLSTRPWKAEAGTAEKNFELSHYQTGMPLARTEVR
ncbi:hypothetical protein M2189_003530 [Bradyrhizobium japonicum]|jgi:hypothetical protein|uniref:Uncharacterized protein n=1 Tax=Bradyrhizobium barranii subsp. barranii TaxID=2823807 RepID=A0A939MDB4_9BRAD|nr:MULTISPECIES: hypothetical protein [Bradyrhizobium]MCS3497512.1 hypothetical protein [Bradyrhizobium japonicum]MCS3960327.1 hypothetical protein [Bradyrhizobium japonicum]MCS4002080.1 hypothetical protein [Bradyrhizobium japonicum]UEM10703.1 hypothetical protein J4G43_039610 [Bradyrhizobium barranii subsp. barranii]